MGEDEEKEKKDERWERERESCAGESCASLRDSGGEAGLAARERESCAAPRSLYFAPMFAGGALERAQKSSMSEQTDEPHKLHASDIRFFESSL